jgi:hypothetical protein
MPRAGHNTTDKLVIDNINKMLLARGVSFDGRPIFRIVWSSDQLELRSGLFRDWYGSIIIREVKDIRRVHKYNYAMDRWILERLTFLPRENKILANELVEVMSGSYEPLFVFWYEDFSPIPVHWQLVEKILWTLENHRPIKKNQKMVESEEIEEKEREIKELEEEIGETQRSGLFAFEDAEFQDSTKQKMWER